MATDSYSSCATAQKTHSFPRRLTEEELDRIALTAPILITRYDTYRRCVYISPNSGRFTAKPASWFLGRSLDEYHGYPSEFLSAISGSIQRIIETGEVQVFETSLLKPSGTRRYAHHQCPEFDDNGSLVSIVSFAIDISDKHNSQVRLQQILEEQNSFLAMLAHELRNPLVAVLSGLQALDRALSAESAQRVREVMHKEVTHITRLIEDLLDTARIETGALGYRKRESSPNECLSLASEIVQPVLNNASQILRTLNNTSDLLVWADPNRVAQVVSNLLHNASKFSPRGSVITLRASAYHETVQIEVLDQGSGIRAEDQSSIFERYVKGRSDTESSSSGLGLAGW